MEITSIDEIFDYFDLEPEDKKEFTKLEKAIGKGLIEIDDETERLNYTVHCECRSTANTGGKASNKLRFRRMTAGDRKFIARAGDDTEKAADAMYKMISRMTGVVTADYDKLHSSESEVCENIWSLFL